MAEREVRLNRAKWIGKNSIRLRFDPFAYRYIRLKVLTRDGYICYWCGGFGNTMDHVIPWSKGGRTTMVNCICACEECNGARGDMLAEEFAALRKVAPPRPESASSRIMAVPVAMHVPLAPPAPVAVSRARHAVISEQVAATAEPRAEPMYVVRSPSALRDLLDPLARPAMSRLF